MKIYCTTFYSIMPFAESAFIEKKKSILGFGQRRYCSMLSENFTIAMESFIYYTLIWLCDLSLPVSNIIYMTASPCRVYLTLFFILKQVHVQCRLKVSSLFIHLCIVLPRTSIEVFYFVFILFGFKDINFNWSILLDFFLVCFCVTKRQRP